MTISEHLEFSVLTAPVAAVDRRALSQAWYSALYGTTGAAPQSAAKRSRIASGGAMPSMMQRTVGRIRPVVTESQRPQVPQRQAIAALGGETERRNPRSPLARKIERAFLRPHARTRKASFALDRRSGRVQVMLQSRGPVVSLIAICPPDARSSVARALEQARYALAARGIDLRGEARGVRAC